MKKYVSKIQELEGELLHIKSLKKSSNCQYSDDHSYDDGPRSNNVLFPSSNESSDCEDKVIDVTGWYLKYCFSFFFACLTERSLALKYLDAKNHNLFVYLQIVSLNCFPWFNIRDNYLCLSSYTLYADQLEFQEKELEHCSLQEKLDMELKELDKRLEEKEVLFSFLECAPFSISSVSLR